LWNFSASFIENRGKKPKFGHPANTRIPVIERPKGQRKFCEVIQMILFGNFLLASPYSFPKDVLSMVLK
jgi:hypothetical protein